MHYQTHKNLFHVVYCDYSYFLKYFFSLKYIKIIFYFYFIKFILDINISKISKNILEIKRYKNNKLF